MAATMSLEVVLVSLVITRWLHSLRIPTSLNIHFFLEHVTGKVRTEGLEDLLAD